MFRTIDETLLVAGQIALDDLATAAAQGVRTIINNRPDGEQPGPAWAMPIFRSIIRASRWNRSRR